MATSIAVANAELTLNGHAFTNFMVGDYLELAYLNPPTSRVNSSDGGVSISAAVDAFEAELTIRLLANTGDDEFLNAGFQAQNGGAVTVFNGSLKRSILIKGSGDNDINGVETNVLSHGSFTQAPTSTFNDKDGNELREYKIKFRIALRQI